jgi:hypothetical protein
VTHGAQNPLFWPRQQLFAAFLTGMRVAISRPPKLRQ